MLRDSASFSTNPAPTPNVQHPGTPLESPCDEFQSSVTPGKSADSSVVKVTPDTVLIQCLFSTVYT